MSQVPHELICQVQICTRAAAGLPDYDPSDPTLPALPPLSAAIAASDPSPRHLRCKNCKGTLLRGTESIICLYCGLGPHYDAAPEPICFPSTIGYQWLLRSLRLDGSEMVDLNDKSQQDLGRSSPKSLTRLSEFLNFKIPWPAETEKQETSSDKHSEDSKRSLSLTGVAPDNFFLKSKRNDLSDMPIEQPSDHNQIETAGKKDVTALNDQDLFQNVRSSESAVSSSVQKATEAFSEWEADFQSADSENQHGDYKSSEHVPGSSADAEIKYQDPESFHSSSGLEVDYSAHFDSVFGPGANLNNGKPKEGRAVSPALDDRNSDDMWNNLSSSEPNLSGGFDANFSTKDEPQNDHALGSSKDLSTTGDLFQDFPLQTNYTDMKETTTEEHRTIDEDIFEEWNDFTGSTSLQEVPSKNAWPGPGVNDQVSTSDEKSSERDLFSFDNKFDGGDFSSFSQPNFFSTSTSNSNSNSNALTEVNAIMSETPAPNWLSDTRSPSLESGQAANNEDAFGQSTKDDVKMLISQMHDLSFMLETDLSVPSGSDAPNSSAKD